MRSVALLLLAACVPGSVAVQLPPTEDMRSMLVAIDADGVVSLEAFDPVAHVPPILRDHHGDARAYVFLDPRPLAELGLEPGPVLVSSGERVRPLPSFARVLASPAWDPIAELPRSLAAVRIDVPRDVCPPIAVEPIALVESATRSIAAVLDDTHALVALEYQHALFRVGEDGRAEQVDTLPVDFRPTGAFGRGDGVVWFSADDRFISWSERDGFGAIIADPLGTSHVWIDGSPRDQPLELFTSGYGAELTRFDGARFELLARGIQNFIVFAGAGGGVAWIAPGEAVGIGRESNAIFHTHTIDEWPVVDRGLMTSIAKLPGYGVVIASNRNRLYVEREAKVWEELPYGPFDSPDKISVMVPVPPRSILFGGLIDYVGEYDREAGFCDAVRLGLQLDVRRITRLGSAYLVTGARSSLVPPDYRAPVAAIIRR